MEMKKKRDFEMIEEKTHRFIKPKNLVDPNMGKKCEAIMERDARRAVTQIVRYESVQGPIIMVKEGEEPTSFWDAFSIFLPLMDTSGSRVENSRSSDRVWPGEWKVDAYVDFEVYLMFFIC